jgi:hypothetical protein
VGLSKAFFSIANPVGTSFWVFGHLIITLGINRLHSIFPHYILALQKIKSPILSLLTCKYYGLSEKQQILNPRFSMLAAGKKANHTTLKGNTETRIDAQLGPRK